MKHGEIFLQIDIVNKLIYLLQRFEERDEFLGIEMELFFIKITRNKLLLYIKIYGPQNSRYLLLVSQIFDIKILVLSRNCKIILRTFTS